MNRTILMLEPDEDDQYITRTVFRENLYSVAFEFVKNSTELFASLDTFRKTRVKLPDLILLDYESRPMPALQVIHTLKSDRDFSYIPVIVLSGLINPDDVRACYQAGASSVILKPASSSETDRKISVFFKYWFETVER